MSTKDRVLAKLKAEEYVSGEDLARELGVSRTAVWKAVNLLRQEGHLVEGVRKSGYRLKSEAERLNSYAIRDYLRAPLKDHRIYVYDSVDSTNSEAKRLKLKGELSPWDLVLAETQTAGRGRKGKTFESPKHAGIYLTLFWKEDPKGLSGENFATVRAAVAVRRGIKTVTGKNPGIKWVNDLYLGGRKICGILTEGELDVENQALTAVYIGIGINVTSGKEDFSENVQKVAGSLKTKNIRNRLIGEIINEMWALEEIPPKEILKEYREGSFLLGKTVSYERDGRGVTGKVLDINDEGHLVLERKGKREILLAGEVSLKIKY